MNDLFLIDFKVMREKKRSGSFRSGSATQVIGIRFELHSKKISSQL